MWILIKTKLPTEISPPIFSIHWAGASAADVEYSRKQIERSKKLEHGFHPDDSIYVMPHLDDGGDIYYDNLLGGYEPKEDGSVWIIFDNEPIKVWPHEYNILTKENFELYLFGETDDYSMSHFPMYGRMPLYADPLTLNINERFGDYSRFERDLYDAALIDGQNDLQAFYTSLGTFPLDLWFAVNSIYGNIYGFSDRDMKADYQKNVIYESIKSGWAE